jgi:hypothetical protein
MKVVEDNTFYSVIEFGEYPQMVVSNIEYADILNSYESGNYRVTGKKYTTNTPSMDPNPIFNRKEHEEIEINGKKFVRVLTNKEENEHYYSELSSGYKPSDYQQGAVFIEVKPIRWFYDIQAKVLVSELCLFAGIDANNYLGNAVTGNFNDTMVKSFIDLYFSKDIQTGRIIKKTESKVKRKVNPYNFNFDRVSEEDIIKGAVESGVSVFLHGLSSDGKSARVKQIDKDAVIIYLRNASPDSLNGKSIVGPDGKLIDIAPTWYQKLKAKCEAEPNKIHILFFDEITNATPNIQGMAYNIVLDKEVNGLWKLPDNARIVAAGNDYNDSLAANQLAEPLFNRFAHVYIKTSAEDWLEWAIKADLEPTKLDYKEEKHPKIHPSIFAFISARREKALRTEYTGDKPNADPRKWELASKILYRTQKPEMLRALIGEEVTRDFVHFCSQKTITLQDVINDNYIKEELEMRMDEKWATIIELSKAEAKDIMKVRTFVSNLGSELLASFDLLWAKGDQQKMEIIAELRLEPKSEEVHFQTTTEKKPSIEEIIDRIDARLEELDAMENEEVVPENLDKLKEINSKLRERSWPNIWKTKK